MQRYEKYSEQLLITVIKNARFFFLCQFADNAYFCIVNTMIGYD